MTADKLALSRTTFTVLLFFAVGCNVGTAPPSTSSTAGKDKPAVAKTEEHDHEEGESDHKHSGWWCPEHGVPEAECALCSPKVAAEFKKKGDWCEKHDRPDSQCFICHPEHEAKFAALYEAKYGKQPPKRMVEEEETPREEKN